MEEADFIEKHYRESQGKRSAFLDKRLSASFAEGLFQWLFVPDRATSEKPESLKAAYQRLQDQLLTLLVELGNDKAQADALAGEFFKELPEIHQTLAIDAEALLQFDPAAQSIEEIFLSYPGFFATALYRIAHQLWNQEIPILPRLIASYAHSRTGIDIHPAARIGKAFAIDHGTGVVIGASSEIGDHVKIYQGVTLGAIHVDKSLADQKRHPTIEDQVTIYAGATILGGKTVIGHDSVIGGNVWLTHSVPPFSLVYQKSEVKVRNNSSFPDPISFVI